MNMRRRARILANGLWNHRPDAVQLFVRLGRATGSVTRTDAHVLRCRARVATRMLGTTVARQCDQVGFFRCPRWLGARSTRRPARPALA